MKKGLLSLLAVALTVVSCQNYDDQFQSLTDQITTLSTTVAGLTALTDQVTALQQTVNGLATTSALSALAGQVSDNAATASTDTAAAVAAADAAADAAAQAGTDAASATAAAATAAAATAAANAATAANATAAVAGTVQSIQASITAILADLANVATAADLNTISATLAIVQGDVKELLAGNATINQSVTIRNEATLKYAETLVATGSLDPDVIVNGSVTIDTSEFSQAQVDRTQTVLDKLATILGNGATAGGLSITTTFSLSLPKLTFLDDDYIISGGVDISDDAITTISGNLTSDQLGIIDYSNLTSVGNVVITPSNTDSITSINFSNATVGSLKISEGATDTNIVDAPLATSIDLGTAQVGYINGDAASSITNGYAGTAVASLTITSLAANGQINVSHTGLTNLSVTGTGTTDLFATSLAGTTTFTMPNQIAEAHLTAAVAGAGAINATVADLTGLARSSGPLDISASTVDLTGYDTTSGTGSTTFSGTDAVVTLDNTSATTMNGSLGSLTILAQDASINFAAGLARLATLNITSVADAAVNPSTQSNDVVVSALASLTGLTVAGAHRSVTSTGNTILTSLTTSGGIVDLAVTGATLLVTANIGHNYILNHNTPVSIDFQGTALGSLDLSALEKVQELTITGNTALTSLTAPSATVIAEAAATITANIGVNSITSVWTPYSPATAATLVSPAVPAAPASLANNSLLSVANWVKAHYAFTASPTWSLDSYVSSGTSNYVNFQAATLADAYSSTGSGTINNTAELAIIIAE